LAAKAAIHFAALTARLKPRPFKAESKSESRVNIPMQKNPIFFGACRGC
jgi:hypothetical protein